MANTLIMVFSDADNSIIKYYHENGYTAYKIWKDNPEKHWDKILVKQPIKRFEAFGTMEKQEGSGRLQTTTTPENEEAAEEIICFQEDHPGTVILGQSSCASHLYF